MNEEERADWLARAIDDLLKRDRLRPKEPPPPELDREELNALMRIARARADAADSLMHTGLQYEGEIWQRVLERLDRRRSSRRVQPFDASGPLSEADQIAAARELDEMEIDELRGIARMRRELAERAASIAEEHREHVWQRVQSRLQAQSPKKWSFPFFRRQGGDERLAASLDRIAAGDDVRDFGEEEIDSLVGIARTRRYWSQMARKAAEEREGRLWTRIASVISQRPQTASARTATWARLAAAGALGAIVLAALGPLPATGLADHPVAGLVRFIGEYVGVSETDEAPSVPPVAGVTEGIEIGAADASLRLGVPVAVPVEAPAGFELTASRFFEEALTADAGGAFALTYGGQGDSSIAIYQERASGGNFAVQGGAATAVTLSDGTAATYVEGMWQQAEDGGLVWSEGGAQTLVFERAGVRTTIQYMGPEAEAPSLFAVADSLAAAR